MQKQRVEVFLRRKGVINVGNRFINELLDTPSAQFVNQRRKNLQHQNRLHPLAGNDSAEREPPMRHYRVINSVRWHKSNKSTVLKEQE